MKNKAIKWLNDHITDTTTVAELELIKFIKKCVNQCAEAEEKDNNAFDWSPMFETLWKLYPRRVNKVLAKRTFEHKVRGLTEQECKDKCNLIYKAEMRYISQIKENDTAINYVKHFSSWLNAEVPNSPKYKGV